MDEKETESTDLERLCQAISPGDAACTYPAAVHWATCGRWFCDARAWQHSYSFAGIHPSRP
jgi:hypothetical protein